jgi:hypothetical protein
VDLLGRAGEDVPVQDDQIGQPALGQAAQVGLAAGDQGRG